MRIHEITDKNLVWKAFYGFDFNFETEYQLAANVCNTLIRLKRINQYQIGLNHINDFKERAYKFLNAKPFDPEDLDVIELQRQVKGMISHLDQLSAKLR